MQQSSNNNGGLLLADAGFGVLLVEYRGYPGSTGNASEQGLYDDARSAYDFINANHSGPIGIYAHSLGTGVAINLALERDVMALVLESPYDSILSLAQSRYWFFPIKALLKHQFLSIEKINKIKAPILMIHGTDDTLIPIAHGKRLAHAAGENVEFRAIKGAGHNNLTAFGTPHQAIEFFAEKLRNSQ